MAVLRTVSIGRPQAREWSALGHTAIDKRPVQGPVRAGPIGLEGDQVGDTRHHGGPDQAVYAYAREDLDWWEGELGLPIRDGHFGENLTTEGIDLSGMVIGTRLRIGGPAGALLEVASVRTPCNDFKGWMGHNGYDPTAWVKRFTAEARPGPYFRVLEPGPVQAGDAIEVQARPDHGITVRDMFRALNTDRSRLPELQVIADLPAKVRKKIDVFVQTQATSLPD